MKGAGPGSHFLIVGPGALGLSLARSLSRAAPVRVLARDGRRERRLARFGALIRGPEGRDHHLRRPYLQGARGAPAGDCLAAFVCVKSRDLPRALAAAKGLVGPSTPVVSLLNGLAHARALRAAFGPARAVPGATLIAAERQGPRRVVHHGGAQVWLSRSSANARAARAAGRWLSGAGLRVRAWRDERRMLWTKLCFNAATNPLAALCRATNGELARDPALRAMTAAALEEALRAARRAGHAPAGRGLSRLLLSACAAVPRQRNSMLQDLEAGRPTEAPELLGPVLAAAKRTRTPTPLLESLGRLLGRLEREASARGRR